MRSFQPVFDTIRNLKCHFYCLVSRYRHFISSKVLRETAFGPEMFLKHIRHSEGEREQDQHTRVQRRYFIKKSSAQAFWSFIWENVSTEANLTAYNNMQLCRYTWEMSLAAVVHQVQTRRTAPVSLIRWRIVGIMSLRLKSFRKRRL